MDRKTEIMVSLGVAIGANCIPCFDHLYARAREVDLAETETSAYDYPDLEKALERHEMNACIQSQVDKLPENYGP